MFLFFFLEAPTKPPPPKGEALNAKIAPPRGELRWLNSHLNILFTKPLQACGRRTFPTLPDAVRLRIISPHPHVHN